MTIEQITAWYNRQLQERLLIGLTSEEWFAGGVAQSRVELYHIMRGTHVQS